MYFLQEGIQTALDNVCDKWVTDFPQHCKGFVSKYSEKIKHAVVKGVKLEDVCSISKACVADDRKSGKFEELCREW